MPTKTDEFVRLATKFIFDIEYRLRNEDFSLADINEKFDVVICNPPFGRDSRNVQNYKNFEFSAMKKNPPMELLFLEKIYNAMAGGATLSIVFPNNILENTTNEFARVWIKNKFQIKEVISLYIGVFKPITNIKTSVLIIKKAHNVSQNYNVNLSIVGSEEDILKNRKDALKIAITELDTQNFTPEFYQRKNSSCLQELSQFNLITLAQIATIKKEKAPILKDKTEKFRYVDISSVDYKTGEIKEARITNVIEAPKRAYYEINKNDLIIAVSGGAIGTKSHVAAVVNEEYDKCICSNGFRALTLSNNVNPYYLWYFMRSEYFFEQVKQCSAGSTIPNLKEKDLMNIKVIIPPIDIQKEIENKVKEYIKKLKEAEMFLFKAEQNLKILMEGGLQSDFKVK